MSESIFSVGAMPKAYESASFGNFENLDDEHRPGKEDTILAIRNWAMQFPWNESGFVLCGEFGTGKTTLLAAMLNSIWKRRPNDAAWVSWIFPYSKAENGEKGWTNIYQEAASYRLLVVDDIWHDSRWRVTHIKRGALGWFLEDRKPDYPIILCTSHASRDEFQHIWGQEITHRIEQYCPVWLTLGGKPLRKKSTWHTGF